MNKPAFKKFFLAKYFVLSCFLLAVLLRVLWVLLIDSKPVSDSNWYYEKGSDIAAGNGYTIFGIPTAYYPVGYPLFLGLVFKIFGSYVLVAKIANILLYIGILYFGYFISKRIFDSELTGRITLLILSIYPNQIAYSSVLSTEVLFLFLLFLGGWLYLLSGKSYWFLILSGITWGLMCLVKPQGIFLPLIFILTLVIKERSGFKNILKTAALVYAFVVLALVPWIVRNYYVFNEIPVISTNDGINLLIGNNPYANGEYFLDERIISYLWDSDNLYSTPDSLVKNLPLTNYWTSYGFKNESVASRKFRNKTIGYVIHNPVQELRLVPKKLWLNYKRGDDGIGWAIAEVPLEPPAKKTGVKIFGKIANYFYYFVAVVSLIYVIRSLYRFYFLKQKSALQPTGLWIVIYFTLLAIIFFGSYRFNFPAIPWLIMYCSAFFGEYTDRNQK